MKEKKQIDDPIVTLARDTWEVFTLACCVALWFAIIGCSVGLGVLAYRWVTG